MTVDKGDLTNVLDILNEAYLDQEEQFDSTLSKENHNYVYPEPGGTEVSDAQNSNHATSVTRTYNVLYGKPSSRKHKTWDLDGTLKVSNNMATLLDVDGSRIGHSKIENEKLTSDSEIHIGGKSVKVMRLTSNYINMVLYFDHQIQTIYLYIPPKIT
ncbi:hypothetical protein M8J77_023141 [Diaphorina citri]|nr:hypothetical protein M8J77_023141 [Diaphorina citri]